MSDIFAPLREPEPVVAPAPDDVRRRGDRLRRRRAGFAIVGAAVAAAIVVGGPSLLIDGRTTSDSPSPPADAPQGDTVIPAQFDLADGLEPGTVSSAGAASLMICDQLFSLADDATASEEVGEAVSGDVTSRGLTVYPDAATAQSVAARLVADLEDCGRSAKRGGREWTTHVRPMAQGDEGWMVQQLRKSSGSRPNVAQVTQVVRVGTYLLVTQEREIHGVGLELLADFSDNLFSGLMHRQMCLLSDTGCAWRSDPDVVTPVGWGAWRLGMSRDEVEATGVAGFSDAGDCAAVDLGSGQGWLTEADGLAGIRVPEGVTTPDGVGVGSSRDEVLESYPVAERKNVMLVRASPTANYEITIERDQVTQLTLTNVVNECTR